ncbi:MAG: glycosyltransferase family 1 protein [Bacteroidota bacterium]|nr:glycosyltransferase family 1 protein [Bacteroidota bacterium]
MNILYYIPYISKEDGGIYQYSLAVLESLKNNLENNYYIFHLKSNTEIEEIVKNHKNLFLVGRGKTKENLFFFFLRNFLKTLFVVFQTLKINIKIKQISTIRHLLKKYDIDIIHSPFQAIPENCNIPLISTMHDVQELHFPEFFTPKQRIQRSMNAKLIIENSDAVIVSYDHIKKDIVKLFNKPDSKVHVVFENLSDFWFNKFLNKKIKYELPKGINPYEFILYPAATWEHKNHLNLIKAIKKLKSKGINTQLICTGTKTSFYYKIKEIVISENLENDIHFIGIVTDKQLFDLYTNSLGVVIPTLYEAGSYILMESILLNVPVICSNVTSLPETMNNNEYIFNPFDINDISAKLELLLTNNEYRKNSIQNSISVKHNIMKNDLAFKFNNIYKEIMGYYH